MRRYARVLAVAALTASLLFVTAQAGPFTAETLALGQTQELLPDLQTLPPRDVAIVMSRSGPNAERRLRFDNRIVNLGNGPVEAYPVSQDCDGDGNARNDRLARQRIYKSDTGQFDRDNNGGSDTHDIGCMVFHARHNHWHIADFATYALYPMSGTGPIPTSTKVSFCMIDTFDEDPDAAALPGEPGGPFYKTCARDAVYGISVGWGDEYQSTLADQWIVININDVPDGNYCLLSTANPSRRVKEVNYDNNAAGVIVTIVDGGVPNPNPTVACVP